VYIVCFVGVPLDVFININVNDISSISEVKMVSCRLNFYVFVIFLCWYLILRHRLELKSFIS